MSLLASPLLLLLLHAHADATAKYVAKLRELKTDNNALLLKLDMSAGHFSASDRYKYLRERSFELAFVLDQLGATALQGAHASQATSDISTAAKL